MPRMNYDHDEYVISATTFSAVVNPTAGQVIKSYTASGDEYQVLGVSIFSTVAAQFYIYNGATLKYVISCAANDVVNENLEGRVTAADGETLSLVAAANITGVVSAALIVGL